MKTKITWQFVIAAFFSAAAIMLLLSGCTTAGKATRYFDGHKDTAAGYCAVRYPVIADSTLQVTVDTAAYNQFLDNALSYGDSLLRVAQERNDQVAAAQAMVKQLREKGEYSESVAQELADELNKIKPVDTAALRRSIEKQIRATLKPCRDTTIVITKENTARVASTLALLAEVQGTADEYTSGRDSPATVFGWLMRALIRKWWFWLIIVAIGGFITRKLWLPKLPFFN